MCEAAVGWGRPAGGFRSVRMGALPPHVLRNVARTGATVNSWRPFIRTITPGRRSQRVGRLEGEALLSAFSYGRQRVVEVQEAQLLRSLTLTTGRAGVAS